MLAACSHTVLASEPRTAEMNADESVCVVIAAAAAASGERGDESGASSWTDVDGK